MPTYLLLVAVVLAQVTAAPAHVQSSTERVQILTMLFEFLTPVMLAVVAWFQSRIIKKAGVAAEETTRVRNALEEHKAVTAADSIKTKALLGSEIEGVKAVVAAEAAKVQATLSSQNSEAANQVEEKIASLADAVAAAAREARTASVMVASANGVHLKRIAELSRGLASVTGMRVDVAAADLAEAEYAEYLQAQTQAPGQDA